MTNMTGILVYKYTVRNGKMFIHEGEVGTDGLRKLVYFDDGRVGRYPKMNEFGVIRSNGPSLYLNKRDDELAKRLFIEFEEASLAALQKQVTIKNELIRNLKEYVV